MRAVKIGRLLLYHTVPIRFKYTDKLYLGYIQIHIRTKCQAKTVDFLTIYRISIELSFRLKFSKIIANETSKNLLVTRRVCRFCRFCDKKVPKVDCCDSWWGHLVLAGNEVFSVWKVREHLWLLGDGKHPQCKNVTAEQKCRITKWNKNFSYRLKNNTNTVSTIYPEPIWEYRRVHTISQK